MPDKISIEVKHFFLTAIVIFGTSALAEGPGWPEHGGDPGGARFSPLDQINRDNVRDLEVAWSFRTGDGEGPISEVGSYGLQGTPILLTEEAGGFLVMCSAFDKVIALNPASGDVVWSFDPEVDREDREAQYKCRGVTQWTDTRPNAPTVCHSRIFLATLDQRLIHSTP